MTINRVSMAAPDVDAAIAQAEAILRRDGVVVLDDLADPSLVSRALSQLQTHYPHFADVDPERNFGAYPGRHTTPVVVEGALADRAIFLPRPVMKLVRLLLGNAVEIDSFGVLVSRPGAEDQDRHPDALLFRETGADCLTPPFAFALAMPLVAMDEVSGTTAFWRGSHKAPHVTGEPDFAPLVPVGSALLWDFRIQHRGLANRSDTPRPVLFSVLCREWWHEKVSRLATRYEKLSIARDAWAEITPVAKAVACRATLVDSIAAQSEMAA